MPLSAEDRLAIADVIARYCHATDSGNGPGVADQFTENGILEITGAWQARGRQQIEQIGSFPNKPKHWINSIVMEGNGSTATSTVYYAAIRGTGPLYATGRYDSQLTKQFNGQWKFAHHCYTGDPVDGPPPPRPRANPNLLQAADRVQIIELIARLNRALQDRDGESLAAVFSARGICKQGSGPEIAGAAALRSMVMALPEKQGSYWTTNYIIEGGGAQATVRAYFALMQGDAVIETGLYNDLLEKIDGEWKFSRHEYVPDQLAR